MQEIILWIKKTTNELDKIFATRASGIRLKSILNVVKSLKDRRTLLNEITENFKNLAKGSFIMFLVH